MENYPMDPAAITMVLRFTGVNNDFYYKWICQLRLVKIKQYDFKTLFLGKSSSMAVRISYFNLLKLLHTYHIGK